MFQDYNCIANLLTFVVAIISKTSTRMSKCLLEILMNSSAGWLVSYFRFRLFIFYRRSGISYFLWFIRNRWIFVVLYRWRSGICYFRFRWFIYYGWWLVLNRIRKLWKFRFLIFDWSSSLMIGHRLEFDWMSWLLFKWSKSVILKFRRKFREINVVFVKLLDFNIVSSFFFWNQMSKLKMENKLKLWFEFGFFIIIFFQDFKKNLNYSIIVFYTIVRIFLQFLKHT